MENIVCLKNLVTLRPSVPSEAVSLSFSLPPQRICLAVKAAALLDFAPKKALFSQSFPTAPSSSSGVGLLLQAGLLPVL